MKKMHQGFLSLFFLLFYSLSIGFTGISESGVKKLIDIVPCELLTSEQVENVMPGHDGGYVAMSGGSLMKGVDSYQCSYSDDVYNLFTVIIHVADNSENFDWIRPKPGAIREMYENVKDLKIGDGGWLFGEPDNMKLRAIKGYTVIELELMSENAAEKGEEMIELAAILFDKL